MLGKLPVDVSRELAVEEYGHLARAVAGRYAARGEPLDDLEQVAYIGLMKASDRFDPTKGVQFATFATATIDGELKRHFRDHRWLMRVPRPVQELYLRVRDTTDELSVSLGRDPTVDEVAAAVGATPAEVVEAKDAGRTFHLGSIDDQRPTGAAQPAARAGALESAYGELVEREAMRSLIDRLSVRQQRVLRLRFEHEMSQTQIADHLGVSQMQVSRVLARSLEQLRLWTTLADGG